MNISDDAVVTLIFILVGIGVFILIGMMTSLVGWITEMKKELKYLNREIHRTEGEEQRYYRKQRRRLLLFWLPFF